MCVVVTGGAGFIGSHLVAGLQSIGREVFVIDNLSSGSKKSLPKGIKFYRQDVRDSKIGLLLKKIKPQVIFHLAAQKSVRKSLLKPQLDADINIRGSLQIFSAAAKLGSKVIYASTAGVYGEGINFPLVESAEIKPESPYVLSKLTAENYLVRYFGKSLPFFSLRLANVYGPRQDPDGEAGVVAVFFDSLLHEKPVKIFGSGEQKRDFIYVKDVIDAMLRTLTNNQSGIYNVGTARETSINDLYKEQAKLASSHKTPEYVPAIPGEVFRSSLSYEKINKVLKWEPRVSLSVGLQETWNWFKTR